MSPEARRQVTYILELLSKSDYLGLERATAGKRLKAADIERAVNDYGRALVPPPDEFEIDAIQVKGRSPPEWSVRVPLWTREEGRSDLTLEMTIIDAYPSVRVELDNIHVL
jgi:hypothetical protein